MKKIRIVFLFIVIVIIAGCSVQEKVSPEIFKERLEKKCSDFVFEDDGFYSNGFYYLFADFKSVKTLFKSEMNDNNTLSSISVSFTFDDEYTIISEIVKPVIEIYSPNEDSEQITKELLNEQEGFYYSYGREYTYSLFINENNVYFEVFNNRLSEYTVPELTLKENDKITF